MTQTAALPRDPLELPALTGLRGLAALLVFGFHLHHLVAPMPVFARGFLGVDVFFVLSGFLLAWLAGQTSAVDWRGFYRRRALRILPALYAQMLVLGVLVGAAGLTWIFPWPGWSDYANQFSLAFHVGGTPLQPLVGPWWSIPVELGFYVLFPLLWWGLRRSMLTTILVVLAMVLAYRGWLLLHDGTSPWLSAWLSLLPGRLEQFLFGMVAAVALLNGIGQTPGRRLPIAAVGLLLCAGCWPGRSCRRPR
ncbi:MAG: acyltransferase [Ahniella sp.]|nr:acyltransferase [Ahniella sp.]